LEIIVVNDGSTDGGEEVVKNFQDSRIRLINQENRGESGARNRGIELAQSPLIAFLDAYDAWRPRFLETVLKLHETYPQAGAYATAYDTMMPYGVNGFLCPLGRAKAFAEKIALLSQDRASLAQMAAAARRVVVERFSLERVATDYDGLFTEALAQPPPPV
jgi:glycosyltransferase involved in cell wall biosynthesis